MAEDCCGLPKSFSKTFEFETRIKNELDTLNSRISDINRLGKKAVSAERLFDCTLEESLQMLKTCAIEVGINSIERARPYFRMVKRLRKAKETAQAHRTAYRRAEGHCQEMKSKLKVAEERVKETVGKQQVDIESLEMLNQAVVDAMEASDLKCTYQMKLHECEVALTMKRKKHAKLQKSLRYDIDRARPYFELKSEINKKLRYYREKLEVVQKSLRCAKSDYDETMHNVENISEEIHKERSTLEDDKDCEEA